MVIDACMVGGADSAFLQQAAHLTGGLYLRPPRAGGLLETLLVGPVRSQAGCLELRAAAALGRAELPRKGQGSADHGASLLQRLPATCGTCDALQSPAPFHVLNLLAAASCRRRAADSAELVVESNEAAELLVQAVVHIAHGIARLPCAMGSSSLALGGEPREPRQQPVLVVQAVEAWRGCRRQKMQSHINAHEPLVVLQTVFCAETYSRGFLDLPQAAGVDFRASCFCHKVWT